VVREEVRIGKEDIVTGEVIVSKKVESDDVAFDLTTTTQGITVERRAVNQRFDTLPEAVQVNGDTTTYRVIREVPTVVTHYEVVEEIVVRKQKSENTRSEVVPVRRERVDVIRTTNP